MECDHFTTHRCLCVVNSSQPCVSPGRVAKKTTNSWCWHAIVERTRQTESSYCAVEFMVVHFVLRVFQGHCCYPCSWDYVVKYVSVTVTGLGDLQLPTNISLVTKESGLGDKDEVKWFSCVHIFHLSYGI